MLFLSPAGFIAIPAERGDKGFGDTGAASEALGNTRWQGRNFPRFYRDRLTPRAGEVILKAGARRRGETHGFTETDRSRGHSHSARRYG